MSQFKQVEDGIFIGPQPTEQDIEEVRQQGIRTVIDFRLPSDLCQNRSRDGPIDFHCHHGIHSQAATQQMLHEGLGHVYISKVESRPSTELLN